MTDTSIENSLSEPAENHPVVIPAGASPPVESPESHGTVQPDASTRRVETTLDALETLSQELADTERGDDDRSAAPLGYMLPREFVLSVVIPVYNELDTINEIVSRVRDLPLPMQIVIVDDCSDDGTRDVLRELESYPEVQIVYQPYNQGKGAALRTGFEQATGDVVVVQDADLEYDPRDIVQLLKPIVKGEADVVYGSRFLGARPKGSSWIHQWGNGFLTSTSNLTTGLKLTDMETCYKLFRRSVLRDLPLTQNRYGFEPEITAKIARRRYRICELPINYHPRGREEGKKIGVRDAFSAFYCIARYAWLD